LKLASMSQVTGLDNTQLLPPYFPFLRGEDLLFGAMTLFLHPKAAVLDLPWAVPHLPLDDRREQSSQASASDLLVQSLANMLVDASDHRTKALPYERLQWLAQEARKLVSRPNRELLSEFQGRVSHMLAEQVQMMEQLEQDTATIATEQWTQWVQQAKQDVIARFGAPGGAVSMLDHPESAAQVVVSVIRGFADALDAWVEMRKVVAI